MLQMDPNKAKELIERYNQGNCTAEEKRLVEDWEAELELSGELHADGQRLNQWQQIIHARLAAQIDKEGKAAPLVHRIHFRRLRWWAAACIAGLLAMGYFIWEPFGFSKSEIPLAQEGAKVNDVEAPKGIKAMITLADGHTILLDSVSNGLLAKQGNIQLIKLADGQITYQTAIGEAVRETQYNTLTNPRGSKVIDITLADGSKVWLNAGSAIRYPVTFIGNERKVEIKGEAYFEIAHDQSRPFFVTKNDMRVQVLGTHFNVNAYDDETDIKVTLMEGTVKVNKGNNERLLKPGQQAQVTTWVKVVNDVNVEQVMAWKNGMFSFYGSDIKTIMRELARWYDVEITYTGGEIRETFFVKTDRNTNVSNVFKILQATGGVHFDIEGKKIVVKP